MASNQLPVRERIDASVPLLTGDWKLVTGNSKNMKQFRFTYTRCNPHGTILEHIVETISGHTTKSVKHALNKRFALQNWTPWRQNSNGGFVKTCTTYAYRGKITVEPIGDN